MNIYNYARYGGATKRRRSLLIFPLRFLTISTILWTESRFFVLSHATLKENNNKMNLQKNSGDTVNNNKEG